MKLPQINYNRPVKSLTKPSISAPAQVFSQQASVTRAAGDLANTIINDAVRHQANTAKSNTLKRMSDWEKEHAGKSFYTSEELERMGIADMSRGRDFVPSYEVTPTLYQQEYERVINEEGEKIHPSKFKDAYIMGATDSMNVSHARKVVEASKAQIKQQNAEIILDIEDLTLDREYGLALDRVKELRVSNDKKRELNKKIRGQQEFGGYVELVNFRDVEGAKAALAKLTTEDSKNLDEQKQYQAIRMLENFLAEDSATAGIEKREAQWELQRIEKAAIAGKFIDLEYYNDVVQRANKAGVEPRYFVETQTAVKANRFARGIANLPADEQMAAMQSRDLSKRTVEGGIESDYMESIVKGNISYMNKDMLGYYHSINGNIPTIDFINLASKPGATAAALKDRMERHNVAESRLKVSQGYLKEEEVNVLADLLLNAKSDDMIRFTQEVNFAMGRDGAHLFDQLRIKRKELGSLTVVGQLAMLGQPGAAQQVLKGHEFRKNNPEVIQDLKLDFLPRIHEKLGGVYNNSPRYLSTVKNAILDVYASKAIAAGENPTDPMDKSLLDEAVAVVTGGIIEHGDNYIEPPYYGATQAIMDNWIENLHPDYIEDQGGVFHYSNKKVIDSLKNEDFQLESVGNGRYVIQTGKGGYLANKQGTQKFILKFDMNAPVVNQSESKVYLDIDPGPLQGPGDFIIQSDDWTVDPADWGVIQ